MFKPEIVRYLREQGHTVVDCGTNSPESVDYPDLAQAVCATLLAGEADAGILVARHRHRHVDRRQPQPGHPRGRLRDARNGVCRGNTTTPTSCVLANASFRCRKA